MRDKLMTSLSDWAVKNGLRHIKLKKPLDDEPIAYSYVPTPCGKLFLSKNCDIHKPLFVLDNNEREKENSSISLWIVNTKEDEIEVCDITVEHLGYIEWRLSNHGSALYNFNNAIDQFQNDAQKSNHEAAKEYIDVLIKNREIIYDEIWNKGILLIKNDSYDQAMFLIECYFQTGGYLQFKVFIESVFGDNKNIIAFGSDDEVKGKIDKEWRFKYKDNIIIDAKTICESLFYNEKIAFGKYKGAMISTIISTDPSYLIWCILNVNHFCLSNPVIVLLLSQENIKNHIELSDAIEINLLKIEIQSIYDNYCVESENAMDDASYNLWDDAAKDELWSMDCETDGYWRDL